MKIIMTTVSPQEALINGYYKLCYPKYMSDYEEYEKLHGDFMADIKQPRNLSFHKKIFAIANCCIDNGILEILQDKQIIKSQVIESLKLSHKDDVYTLIYIAKFLFLSLEKIVKPDGSFVEVVSSISFEKMDHLEFTEFFKNFISWCADLLGVSEEELQNNSVGYL